jgi:hypothetical protein
MIFLYIDFLITFCYISLSRKKEIFMKAKLFFLSLAALSAMLFYGCFGVESSEDVNQDRIYAVYELTYDGNRDVTVAKSWYKFGNNLGTQLELSSGSTVSCNGSTMVKKVESVTNIVWYEHEFAGLVETGEFIWVDADGKSYTNSITLVDIAFPASVDPMSRNTSHTLVWAGGPVADDQEVWVSLFRLKNAALAIYSQTAAGSADIILDRAKLITIDPGEINMSMERKVIHELSQATSAGGKIVGRYFPPNITATITD